MGGIHRIVSIFKGAWLRSDHVLDLRFKGGLALPHVHVGAYMNRFPHLHLHIPGMHMLVDLHIDPCIISPHTITHWICSFLEICIIFYICLTCCIYTDHICNIKCTHSGIWYVETYKTINKFSGYFFQKKKKTSGYYNLLWRLGLPQTNVYIHT